MNEDPSKKQHQDGSYTIHTPLVLSTDVWPSHADDEDPTTPILGWVVESSLNGFSFGIEYVDDEPTPDVIERFQRGAFVALRDAALGRG